MSKRIVKIDRENHIIWFDDGSNGYYTAEEDNNSIIDKEYQNGNHASYYGGRDNPYECDKVINAWGENRITGVFKMAGILEQFSDIYVVTVIRKAILKSKIYKNV